MTTNLAAEVPTTDSVLWKNRRTRKSLVRIPRVIQILFTRYLHQRPIPRIRRIIAHTQQIIDGVLILAATETIVGDSRTRRHPRRSTVLQQSVDGSDEALDFAETWLRLIPWRHFAAVDIVQSFSPVMSILAGTKISRHRIQPQITLNLLRTVAADAPGAQELLLWFAPSADAIEQTTEQTVREVRASSRAGAREQQ